MTYCADQPLTNHDKQAGALWKVKPHKTWLTRANTFLSKRKVKTLICTTAAHERAPTLIYSLKEREAFSRNVQTGSGLMGGFMQWAGALQAASTHWIKWSNIVAWST